ncbi:hypothetical protein Tco_0691465 [Tanacetum coccineum]
MYVVTAITGTNVIASEFGDVSELPEGANDEEDEDEREPMFVQAHDPDYVPEPIYHEYIPLEDEHKFSAEEQPLPLIDSPTTESPGYVTESDPEEDPEEYEDDKTEDGPVDYPMGGGDDGDDDDGDSSKDDVDGEDEDEEDEEEEEEEEEHLAPADSTIVALVDEPVFPPEGTEPVIPPPSTDITIGARLRLEEGSALLGSRYEIRETSTARPTRGRGIDYGFVSTVDAEKRRQGIRDVGYGIRDTLGYIPAREQLQEIAPYDLERSSHRISQRVDMDSQRVDLLMGDRMTLQETVWMVEEKPMLPERLGLTSIGFESRHSSGASTHRDHVYAHETYLQAHQTQLQLQQSTTQ